MNTDFIYYISVEGNLLEDLIFETEELAQQFAEEQKYDDYFIIRWSVD